MAESDVTGKALAWDIRTTAQKLSVHERTVRRMLDSHELPCIRIRGAIRIPVKAVEQLLEPPLLPRDNYPRAGSAVQGASTCPISAKKVRTGGHRLSMQAERELDALLEPPTVGKRKPSKQS